MWKILTYLFFLTQNIWIFQKYVLPLQTKSEIIKSSLKIVKQ